MASIVASSGPAIFTPTGVLMPVASMSIRVLIGMTHAFVSPGTCTARSSSARMPSGVMPGRHSSRGLKRMTVSIMVSGAGSVAVSARPILPNTWDTSGTVWIIRSVCCKSSRALSIEMPG